MVERFFLELQPFDKVLFKILIQLLTSWEPSVSRVDVNIIGMLWGDDFYCTCLIAGCNIGVQLSVRPSFRPSTSVTINFSVPMMARIMKPCIVIVLDMLYKHTH